MKYFIKQKLNEALIKEYYDDYEDFNIGLEDDFYEPKKKPKVNKVSFLDKYSDIIRLYRILVADSIEDIDTNYPGYHYSMDKNNLLKTHSFLKDKKYYLLTIDAPKTLIDVKTTMKNNELYPNEKEITLKNKGKGVKIIKIEPLN